MTGRSEEVFFETVEAPGFEPVCLAWKETGSVFRAVRVFLPRPGVSAMELLLGCFQGAVKESCAESDEIVQKIGLFLRGSDVVFPREQCDMSLGPDYQKSVLMALNEVPRGSVTTYGRLAERTGGCARSVGNALSANPFPLIVPCHRVVRANGETGEYQGGFEMKRILLANEGVGFDRRGRCNDTV